MRFGRPERGVEARLVDRAIDQGGRRPGRGERSPDDRREPFRRGRIEAALERKDVPIQPGQEVETGTQPGIRELRQVGMEIDHPRQHDPRPKIGGGGRIGRSLGSRPGEGQAPGRVDQQQAIGFMTGSTGRQRRQQPRAQRERGSSGQMLRGHRGRC